MNAIYAEKNSNAKLYIDVVAEINRRKITNIRDAYAANSSIAEELRLDSVRGVNAAIEFYFDEYTQMLWEGRSIEEYMTKNMI